MKTREKSTYFSTCSTKPNFRPNSAAVKRTYTGVRMTNLSTEVPPPIYLPSPSNPKKLQGMGNNMEPEELYKKVMDLKDYNNKLSRELQECKTNLVKKDIELKKKEKLLKECNKENDIQIVHEEKLEQAKESTLLTLCKQKYYELKKEFVKKCEENENLKANIKITRIKEFQIENDILQKELEKLRGLYEFNQKEKEISQKKIRDLEELKDKYIEQHMIIKSYIEKNEEVNKKNNELYSEINVMQGKLERFEKEKKKNMIEREKMNKKLENFMANKKVKENLALKENDNLQKIIKLRRDLEDYKRMYNQKETECKRLQSQGAPKSKESFGLKPIKYDRPKQIEGESKPTNDSIKISLLESLLHEAQVKNKIYEEYIKSVSKEDPKEILRKNGFNDVLNSKCPPLNLKASTKESNYIQEVNNLSNKISNYNDINVIDKRSGNNDNDNNFDNTTKSNIYKTAKSDKVFPETGQMEFSPKNSDELNNDNKENNIKVLESKDNLVENADDNDEQEGENEMIALLHVFIKNLEAHHITQQQLNYKIEEIFKLFQNKEEATKEEFLEPFIKMMIECMGVTKKDDIDIITAFLNNLIDSLDGDTANFFTQLNEIFRNIIDYSNITNEKELLNQISLQLAKYKEGLLSKIELETAGKEEHVITFASLRKIVRELEIRLTDDFMEYLIYKMKASLNGAHSIFDLSTSIIEELLNKNYDESKKEDTVNLGATQ